MWPKWNTGTVIRGTVLETDKNVAWTYFGVVNKVCYIKYNHKSTVSTLLHSKKCHRQFESDCIHRAVHPMEKISGCSCDLFILTSVEQMHYVPNYSLQWDISYWPIWPLLDECLRHKFKSCGCHCTNYSLKSQVGTKLPRMPWLFPQKE